MSEYKKPIPVPSQESQPYWDGLREQKLMMPRCDDCKSYWFPPSLLCPRCNSANWTWTQDERPRPHLQLRRLSPRLSSGFAQEVPYAVAVIELDEGPRMYSNVIGVAPDKLACDMKVEVAYEPITDAITLPKFKPVAA